VRESAIVEGDWSAESGERGATALLERHPDLDAIFASNDQMALGALVVARRTGRRVPEDVAVVGFDNIPESPFFWPPLTTVYQKVTDAGCIAVQQLHSMIQSRRETERTGRAFEAATILLPPELIERESSGRPG
jgi:DNA-binding LacI/PurR family transcriptional regulator